MRAQILQKITRLDIFVRARQISGCAQLCRRLLPFALAAVFAVSCTGCTSSPRSRAHMAAIVLRISGAPRPVDTAGPMNTRPSDFALPHGRDGEPYIEALPPGAIAHDHRGL
jgi:hypothetical protein